MALTGQVSCAKCFWVLMKAVFNRVTDAIKEGSTIKYISSYVDRVFRSIERQARLYIWKITVKRRQGKGVRIRHVNF
jgi:hypothetical protein